MEPEWPRLYWSGLFIAKTDKRMGFGSLTLLSGDSRFGV